MPRKKPQVTATGHAERAAVTPAPPNNRTEVYRRLLSAGMSQAAVAAACGVTRQAVHDAIHRDAATDNEARRDRWWQGRSPTYQCGACGQLGHNRRRCPESK
jgi:hypothetical protein